MPHEGTIARPPLPAWPAEVLLHEPAHGLFKRIAQSNGQISISSFAAAMGVKGRFVDPQELMDFCFQFPIRNLPHLKVSTPRLTGSLVEILGEKFSKRDWTLNRPRVCPGCIAESRHHRAWFDLTLLRSCPIHNEILVGEVNGEQFATWFPGIGVAPSGALARPTGKRLDDQPRSWENYMLGRMGVVRGFPVPWLDDQELFEIVEAANLLSSVVARCRSASTRDRRGNKTYEARATDVAAGFGILSKGEAAVASVLRPLVELPSTSNARWWLYCRMRSFSGTGLAPVIRSIVARVSSEYGLLARRGNRAAPNNAMTLGRVAGTLGVSLLTARRVAGRLGHIDPDIAQGRAHQVKPAAVEHMRSVLATLLERDRAIETVGVSPLEFEQLCLSCGIEPLARIGGPWAKYDRFQPCDLERLVLTRD